MKLSDVFVGPKKPKPKVNMKKAGKIFKAKKLANPLKPFSLPK